MPRLVAENQEPGEGSAPNWQSHGPASIPLRHSERLALETLETLVTRLSLHLCARSMSHPLTI